MKNLYSIVLILLCFTFLTAQTGNAQNQIPNADFENWTGGNPDSWDSSNENILGTDFVCVTRDMTNPVSGTSSAKIASVSHNIFLVGPVTMPGLLTLGNLTLDYLTQSGTVTGGVPVSGQPKHLKGYFKYTPASGDSCILGIGLTKWNGTGSDTLAAGYLTIGEPVSDWLEFDVPIEYYTWDTPDTMNIMFFSSNMLTGVATAGSTLWVDSLWLEYSQVSVYDIGLNKELFVYQNNDGQSLIVNTPLNNPVEISIFSLNGNIVNSATSFGDRQSVVNIGGLSRGIYIVRVTFADGKCCSVKFSHI